MGTFARCLSQEQTLGVCIISLKQYHSDLLSETWKIAVRNPLTYSQRRAGCCYQQKTHPRYQSTGEQRYSGDIDFGNPSRVCILVTCMMPMSISCFDHVLQLCKVFGGSWRDIQVSLCYFCKFALSLKLTQNKKLLKSGLNINISYGFNLIYAWYVVTLQ